MSHCLHNIYNKVSTLLKTKLIKLEKEFGVTYIMFACMCLGVKYRSGDTCNPSKSVGVLPLSDKVDYCNLRSTIATLNDSANNQCKYVFHGLLSVTE